MKSPVPSFGTEQRTPRYHPSWRRLALRPLFFPCNVRDTSPLTGAPPLPPGAGSAARSRVIFRGRPTAALHQNGGSLWMGACPVLVPVDAFTVHYTHSGAVCKGAGGQKPAQGAREGRKRARDGRARGKRRACEGRKTGVWGARDRRAGGAGRARRGAWTGQAAKNAWAREGQGGRGRGTRKRNGPAATPGTSSGQRGGRVGGARRARQGRAATTKTPGAGPGAGGALPCRAAHRPRGKLAQSGRPRFSRPPAAPPARTASRQASSLP